MGEDITQVGALTYRDLQGLNNSNKTSTGRVYSDGSSDDDESAKALRLALQMMTPSTSANDWMEQNEGEVKTSLADTATPWGESMFDNSVATADEAEHLGDIRADNQPWYAKIAAGIVKGAITAGTTFIDGTIGLVTGIGTTIYRGEVSGIWDNPITNAMKYITDKAEEIIPNYYTEEEQNNAWYENLGTANFWGDKFIKNLGFTLGAVYSGGVYTKILNYGVKGLKWAGAVSKATKGQKLEAASRVVRKTTGAPPVVSSIVGSFTSAVGEGSIEALNNTEDWKKLRIAELQDKVYTDLQEAEKEYALTKGTLVLDPETGRATDPAYEKYLERKALIENTYKEALVKIDNDAKKMGNRILALNIPILTASNIYMYGKYYSGGYTSNNLASYIARRVKDDVTTFKTSSKWQAIKAVGGKGASEGTEEIMQRYAAEIPGVYYGDKLNNFYESRIHPDAEQKAISWMNSISEGFANTFLSEETFKSGGGFEEFFIGALTGMLGIPQVKTVTRADGTKSRRLAMTENVFTSVQDYLKNRREAAEVVAYLNERVQDPAFIEQYRGIIGHIRAEQEMNEALKKKKRFDFKNAEHKQLLNDIIMFDRAGALDVLEAQIGEAFDTSDENLAAVITTTTNKTKEGELIGLFSEYAQLDQDGNIIANVNDNNREDIIFRINKNKKEIEKTIDQYKKSKRFIESRLGNKVNNEQLAELTWLHANQQHWWDRIESIYKDFAVKDLLSVVRSFDLSQKENLQGLLDIFGIAMTNEEKEKIQKAIENNNIQEIISALESSDKKMAGIFAYMIKEDPEQFDSILNFFKKAAESQGYTDADEAVESLRDVGYLADGIKQFQDLLEEYLKNPEKQAAAHETIKQKIKDHIKAKKEVSLKEQLEKADENTDIDELLQNSDLSDEEKQNLLKEVSKTNKAIEKYQKNKAFLDKLAKNINDAIDKKELDDLATEKGDTGADDAFSIAEQMIYDGIDPDNINENTIAQYADIFIEEDPNNGAARFDKASKILNRILNKIRKKRKAVQIDRTQSQPTQSQPTQSQPTTKEIVIHGEESTDDLNNHNDAVNDTQAQSEKDIAENKKENDGKRKYYRPVIPELHIERRKKRDYRPFWEVSKERENTKFQAIWEYLKDKGAFDYVNSGKLKVGDKIYFLIDPTFQGIPGSQPIFMAVKDAQGNLQIVGSLDEGSSMDRYAGLRELSNQIREEYKKYQESKSTELFVATPTTSVSEVMLGVFELQQQERSVGDILEQLKQKNPNAKIGFAVVKNGELVSPSINSKDIESIGTIIGGEGLLYVLLPNSRGTYTPMSVRIKHFDSSFDLSDSIIAATPIGKKLDELFEKLSQVDSSDSVADIMKQLRRVIFMKDFSVYYTEDPKTGDTYLRITVNERDSEGKLVYKEIDGKQRVKTKIINKIVLTHVDKDSGEVVHLNDAKEKLIKVFQGYDLPIQVDYSLLKEVAYVQRLLNSGVITSNIKNPSMRSSWFTVNPIINGKEVGATNPSKKPVSPVTSPIPGSDNNTVVGIPIEIVGDITIGGENMKGKTLYIDNDTVRNEKGEEIEVGNKELKTLKTIAWANKQQGTNVITYNNIKYVVDNRGKVLKVFNTATQKYEYNFSKVRKEVLSIYNGTQRELSKREEADRVVGEIFEAQKKVDKEKTDSENYYILEEDGEWHPYQRVHTVIGDNWVGEQKPAASKAALIAGNTIDSIVRDFFNNNGTVTKPEGMAQEAFDTIMKKLNEIKKTIDERGETFYANNIVLYHKNSDGTRVAGEVDILSVTKDGQFNIYDVKTSRWGFSKNGYFSAQTLNQKMSTKDYYTLQLNKYAELLFKQFGVKTNKIALLPFTLNYDLGNGNIKTIETEAGIKLPLNPTLFDTSAALQEEFRKAEATQNIPQNNSTPTPAPTQPVQTQEQQKETKKRSNVINAGRSRRIKHRNVDNTGTTGTINLEKELAWLDKVLPQVSREEKIQIVKGLLNAGQQGAEAWGQFIDGIITLSDIAAEGTVFHEAFHYVFNSILTAQDRVAILKEAKEIWGDIDKVELEEKLAEDFREFVQNQQAKKTWGQKIIDFFKRLLHITSHGYEMSSHLLSLYRNINEGKYAQKSQNTTDVEIANDPNYTQLKNDITEFFKKFQIEIKELSEYDSQEPIFDALNRIIYAKSIDDIIDNAGYAIAFMLQHNYLIHSQIVQYNHVADFLVNRLTPGKIRGLVRRAFYNKLKNEYLHEIGRDIGNALRDLYNIKVIDRNSLSFINSFISKMIQYNPQIALSTLAAAVKNGDYTVIERSLRKPRSKEDTNIVNIEEALANPKNAFEVSIISFMTEHNIGLGGSTSVAVVGRVLRPSENPFHDLDFEATKYTQEEIEKILKDKKLHPIFHRAISNKGNKRTVSYIVSNRDIYEKVSKYNIIGKIRRSLLHQRVIYDKETDKAVAIIDNSNIKILDPTLKLTILDFFTKKDITQPVESYGSYTVSINGIPIVFSNYKNAMMAKVEWQRDKDIWDYVIFVKKEAETNEIPNIKTLKNSLSMKAFTQVLDKANIIWMSPTIGKTKHLETSSDFIDWDDFVGKSITRFLEAQIDPKIKKYNKKGVLNLKYLKELERKRVDFSNTSYIEFIKQKFAEFKAYAKQQGKIGIVSNIMVLKYLNEELDAVIAVPNRTFISREYARHGNYREASSLANNVNIILAENIPSSKVFYTDFYLHQLMKKFYGSTWKSLNNAQRNHFVKKGIDKGKFNSQPKEIKEEMENCALFN